MFQKIEFTFYYRVIPRQIEPVLDLTLSDLNETSRSDASQPKQSPANAFVEKSKLACFIEY